MIAIEYILVSAAVLLLFSILASKVSSRLGIPALLLFSIASRGPAHRVDLQYSPAQ
jgi:NhaP-type Na+/H+ and K+/H+ antiporter